jgi:DNA polymerase
MTMFPVLVDGNREPAPCKWIIIGEAPGKRELRQHPPRKPFIGRAGDLLYATLWRERAEHASVYVTNAFKGDVFEPSDRHHRPTANELKDHFDVLKNEIRVVAPEIILTLGAPATHVLLPDLVPKPESPICSTKSGIDLLGRVYQSPRVHPRVMPCYHPSFVLRGGMPREQFAAIIRNFLDWKAGQAATWKLPASICEALRADPWKDMGR